MKIDIKNYPIVDQIQNGRPNLNLNRNEFNLFYPYLGVIEGIIKSKPVIDYLCSSQINNVFTVGEQYLKSSEFYNTDGVLLTPEGTYVYRVRKNSLGDAEVDIFFCISSKILYYIKIYLSDSKEITTVVTGYPNDQNERRVKYLTLLYLLFKKKVKVQNKIISTQTNRKYESKSEVVKTNFKYPINIIDAYYFTNYTSVGPTLVKAHIRKYPNGKVVEIRGHSRSGFKRKAKKLLTDV